MNTITKEGWEIHANINGVDAPISAIEQCTDSKAVYNITIVVEYVNQYDIVEAYNMAADILRGHGHKGLVTVKGRNDSGKYSYTILSNSPVNRVKKLVYKNFDRYTKEWWQSKHNMPLPKPLLDINTKIKLTGKTVLVNGIEYPGVDTKGFPILPVEEFVVAWWKDTGIQLLVEKRHWFDAMGRPDYKYVKANTGINNNDAVRHSNKPDNSAAHLKYMLCEFQGENENIINWLELKGVEYTVAIDVFLGKIFVVYNCVEVELPDGGIVLAGDIIDPTWKSHKYGVICPRTGTLLWSYGDKTRPTIKQVEEKYKAAQIQHAVTTHEERVGMFLMG